MKTVRPNLAAVQALETGNVSIKPLPHFPTKTDLVKDPVQLNGRKLIITNKDGSTSQPGVFAAGDVTDRPYKQAVISAGQGAIAAHLAYHYLQKLKGRRAVRGDWKTVVKKS